MNCLQYWIKFYVRRTKVIKEGEAFKMFMPKAADSVRELLLYWRQKIIFR